MPLGDSVLSTPVRVIKRQQKLEIVFCGRGQLNLIVKNPEKTIDILSQELLFAFFFFPRVRTEDGLYKNAK